MAQPISTKMEGIQPTTSLFCLRSVRTDGTLPATGSSVVLTDRRQDWVFRDKGKGKGKIAVPENCTIFLRDGKQLCKKFQVGACRAKGVKPGKRCSYGYHMRWQKGCHKTHPGKQCPGTGTSDKMDVNKYACSDLACSPGGVTRHWLTFNTRNGYVWTSLEGRQRSFFPIFFWARRNGRVAKWCIIRGLCYLYGDDDKPLKGSLLIYYGF